MACQQHEHRTIYCLSTHSNIPLKLGLDLKILQESTISTASRTCISPCLIEVHNFLFLLRPVLLAGRDREQRWFGGRRDLDYSTPRVRWLHTPLRGKAEAQGTRPSRPKKKGTRPIGNSRGIAVQVGRLLSGSGKVLDTFLCPLHESGLVEGERM